MGGSPAGWVGVKLWTPPPPPSYNSEGLYAQCMPLPPSGPANTKILKNMVSGGCEGEPINLSPCSEVPVTPEALFAVW